MLHVAKQRLKKENRKAVPKKPVPPEIWVYSEEYCVRFFWAWLRADCNPVFTPDGKPWQDQDDEFWNLIWYLKDLFDWAMHRAKNPVMTIKANMPSIGDL